ncbi:MULTISPECIES: hypothetical protein [Enterobacterales]
MKKPRFTEEQIVFTLKQAALGWMMPSEFAEKSAGCQNMQPD